MRRVLAVLISVLTAVWPLLLPQPVSANPCSVNTMAESANFSAKAGHYINQKGDLIADNSGDAGKAYGGKGYGGQASGGTADGGTGEGGYATTNNTQYAKGGLAVASQVAVNAQDTDNKAKNSSSADGGAGGTSYAGSLNAAIPVAAQLGAGNALAGGGNGGNGGTPVAVGGVQVPIAGGNSADGGDGNTGTSTGNTGGASSAPGGNGGLNNLPIVPIHNNASGSADGGRGGDGGNGGGNGGGSGDAVSLALQKGTAWAGDANGGKGTGGDADGYAKNSASSDIDSKTKAGSSDGGNGGDVWNKAGQNNEQHASNDDNSAFAKGGKNHLTSTNTANGGTGGAGGSADATGGAGTGGAATGGSTAERTVGSNTKSVGEIAAVSTSVDVGGASGDPCKQIIKDSTGVLAINGVNKIKNSDMQNATTQLGNAANTSVNLGELVPQGREWGVGYPMLKNGNSQAPGVNININPNNNQNTNIISF